MKFTMIFFSLGLSVSGFAALKVGQPFPKFETKMISGKGNLTNTNFKGKVTVIDFWATWCEPCKKELPALNTLYKKYKSKGVMIVGINLDEEPREAAGFFKDLKISFPSGNDAKKKLPEQLGISTMPTSYILDKKGVVRFIQMGFREGEEEKIEKNIKSLL